jgi:hypothetical protein
MGIFRKNSRLDSKKIISRSKICETFSKIKKKNALNVRSVTLGYAHIHTNLGLFTELQFMKLTIDFL